MNYGPPYTSWLPPARSQTPPGASAPFFKGPYTCEMAFAMRLKQGEGMPEHLYASLLTHLPDPDGGNYRELEGGHSRHPIRLVIRSASHFAISHPLLFDAFDQVAAGLALFDSPDAGEGSLWFYGTQRAVRTQNQLDTQLEFPAYSVLLKRSRAYPQVF